MIFVCSFYITKVLKRQDDVFFAPAPYSERFTGLFDDLESCSEIPDQDSASHLGKCLTLLYPRITFSETGFEYCSISFQDLLILVNWLILEDSLI